MAYAKLRTGEIKILSMRQYWALVEALWINHKDYRETVVYIEPEDPKGYEKFKQVGLSLKYGKN